jgi:FAD/FMN-containing dehydrogenase
MWSNSRRDFLKLGCALLPVWKGFRALGNDSAPATVNDIHSQLNATHVNRIVKPTSAYDLSRIVAEARSRGIPISIAGGRHSMGGQQFGTDTILVDMTGMNRVIGLDSEKGIVEAEAGIEWPSLIDHLVQVQAGRKQQWGIIQKQTGADRLSLGGALASNIHSRGLQMKPFIADVESFDLVDERGEVRRCDRSQNSELFALVIGGYGLFGIVSAVRLRLAPRRKLERVVEMKELKDVIPSFEKRIADGYLYGDYQFATESKRDDFMRSGVFPCYRPVDISTPIPPGQKKFSDKDWARLTYYAHKYKRRAFKVYTKRYLATSGQVYWSDEHQLAAYDDNYHAELDRRLHARVPATEMITEIYVPRELFVAFMEEARQRLREHQANLIYGTVRLVERDDESFLVWARQPYACIVFNLHVTHDPVGIENAARAFRSLIDCGIHYGGSYYLTYHRWATREQVETCYPMFTEFLRMKRTYDPDEMFQSDWYRHYKKMFQVS